MRWKSRETCLGILYIVLVLVTPSLGAFEDTLLGPLTDPPPGVVVEPNPSGNSKIKILENVPKTEEEVFRLRIAQIFATGPEIVTLSIVSSGPPPPVPLFDVETANGEWFLVLIGRLDYETVSKFVIRLTQGSSFRFFDIETVDENDNAVIIEGTIPSILDSQEELKDFPDPIMILIVTDKDEIDVGKITYKLEVVIGSQSQFRMDGGQLFIQRQLNYKEHTMHRLKISVFDSGNIHNDSIIITIDVIDTPNLPPEWTLPPSIKEVPEDTAVNTIIQKVTARDGDFGKDWPIEYFLTGEHTGPGIDPYFKINQSTGDISIIRTIDAEELFAATSGLSITLIITAKEKATAGLEPLELQTNGSMFINIRDINDQFPQLCATTSGDPTLLCKDSESFSVRIPENSITTLSLDKPFIVRDLDPTLQFSKYTAVFGPTTPQVIQDALQIQPSGESSGITEYSIGIKDPSKLDYEGFDFSKPISFQIVITEKDIPTHIATANVLLTVTDINDNSPVFVTEGGTDGYEFFVCENLAVGTVLKKVDPDDPAKPICPSGADDGEALEIMATDEDKSDNYGSKSVRYRWYSKARPPIDIDPITGRMTVNNLVNFDYERLSEEFFTVEAYDNPTDEANQRVTNTIVRFKILDVNDSPVDLKVPPGRPNISEGLTTGSLVLRNIVAEDADLDADIRLTLSVNKVFTKNGSHPSGYISTDTIDEDIEKWFEIKITDDTNNKKKIAEIVIGQLSPDREGNKEREIDRVDLTITAEDLNTAPENPGARSISQPLTIMISDINDEKPYWEDNLENIQVTVTETEGFDSGGDNSSDVQREIYTFRARDPDKETNFVFGYKIKDCPTTAEICKEMEELVVLDAGENDKLGKAILRRQKNKQIDREEQKFYGKDTDQLVYTITVSDGILDHTASVDIIITVDDINDNTPAWDKKYNELDYEVDEGVKDAIEIVKFLATDKDKKGDKFGKVNYRLIETATPTDGFEQFDIDEESGSLTAKPGAYNWTHVPKYTVTVEAIDYYRPSSSSDSGSNRNQTTIDIVVKDSNNHDPEFVTDPRPTLLSIKEDLAQDNTAFNETVLIKDIDNPSVGNAQFTVEIIKVVKESEVEISLDPMPFKIGELFPGVTENFKNAQIISTKNFTGSWGVYYVTFKATDKGSPNSRSSEETYKIVIENVNFNDPEFVYPDAKGSTRVLIALGALPGRIVTWDNKPIDPVYATDKDDFEQGNGEVVYSIVANGDEDDGSTFFGIPNDKTGVIYLSKPLEDPDAQFYKLTIKASDLGEPPRMTTTVMTIVVVPNDNREPRFATSTQNLTIQETDNIIETEILSATDPDSELVEDYPEIGPQIIYYFIVGGSVDYFETGINSSTKKPVIRTKQLLDRETIESHQIVIFVSNTNTPPPGSVPPENIDPDNASFLLVNIIVGDEYDTPPEYARQDSIYSGGISTSNSENDTVTQISVIDSDLNDEIIFAITSAIKPSDPSLPISTPFRLSTLSNSSTALLLQFLPQPSMKGFYTFEVTATDLGNLTAVTSCKIYVIEEIHFITFTFLNRLPDVLLKMGRVADILSDAFGYRCNIDKTTENVESSNATDVRTYFIDLTKDEPVNSGIIYELQFDPEVFTQLRFNLTVDGLSLAENGVGNAIPVGGDDKMITYLLLAGIGVLIVVLIVLAATCYFNNRGLSRRVKALTATTFGSQMSGLNRTGAALDLPNTNEFAIEGSNPFWATNPSEKKMPAFDAESIGSGGSVLIGVEDDDDFKNYKSTNNPLFGINNNNSTNNMGQEDLSDDDLYDTVDDDKRREYAFERDTDPDEDAVVDNNFNFGGDDEDGGDSLGEIGYDEDNGQVEEELTDLPLPPTTRRNPLMNMAFQEDDE